LALFIVDVVWELDLSAIERVYEGKDDRGRAGFDPRMMVALLLYAYCVGKPSSRKIERATYEDVAFRVVSGDQHPDHDCIATFRKEHLAALAQLFTQVLKLCQQAGLVKLGHIAIDGSKLKANASKHKAMSYARMGETEKKLQEEVESLLAEAERLDAEEDATFGRGRQERQAAGRRLLGRPLRAGQGPVRVHVGPADAQEGCLARGDEESRSAVGILDDQQEIAGTRGGRQILASALGAHEVFRPGL